MSAEPDDPEAAALCINFMVRSLEETPRGVSDAMMTSLTAKGPVFSFKISKQHPCRTNCELGTQIDLSIPRSSMFEVWILHLI